MSSDKKIAANRLNGRKSSGPRNTNSTRFNATKHGLLALGITELDDSENYYATLKALMEEKKPVGPLEVFLVKSAALDMVRWQRARRLEAEFITAELNPPLISQDTFALSIFGGDVLDAGLPAALGAISAQQLVAVYQRYETSFSNRLFRTLHELERIQRIREGEILMAPAAVDVNVNMHAGLTEPTPIMEKLTELPSDEDHGKLRNEPNKVCDPECIQRMGQQLPALDVDDGRPDAAHPNRLH